MNNIIEFFKTAEHLHYEKRTTRMSDGEQQSVAAHCFMLSLMAITFVPKASVTLNMERVLKLCAAHDLPESKSHDIPAHKTLNDDAAREKKEKDETEIMNEFTKLLNNSEFETLWQEYEEQKTPESKFVKMLDRLDVCFQTLFSKTLDHIGSYDNGVYWKWYFSKSYRDMFASEPALLQVFDEIQKRLERRIKTELNINPDDFKE